MQPQKDLDAERFAEDFVSDYVRNVKARNVPCADSTALFEKACAYRDAKKVVDNQRAAHEIVTDQEAAEEHATRKEFLEAHHRFHEAHR